MLVGPQGNSDGSEGSLLSTYHCIHFHPLLNALTNTEIYDGIGLLALNRVVVVDRDLHPSPSPSECVDNYRDIYNGMVLLALKGEVLV